MSENTISNENKMNISEKKNIIRISKTNSMYPYFNKATYNKSEVKTESESDYDSDSESTSYSTSSDEEDKEELEEESEKELIEDKKPSEEKESNDKNNMESMLEKLIYITTSLNNKLNELDKTVNTKFNELETRIIKIESKITIPTVNNECIEDLKELVKEKININKDIAMKALTYRDYRSILTLFRLYYKNENNERNIYPIRSVGTRKFEYYANKKWNSDLYGSYSMETIINNFQDLFIKYNCIDEIGYDNFIQNQDFIQKLDNDKIRKSIFKTIVEEIRD